MKINKSKNFGTCTKNEKIKRHVTLIFKTMATESEKILRRAAHLCFEYRGEVYIWGGYIEHHSKVSSQQNDTF